MNEEEFRYQQLRDNPPFVAVPLDYAVALRDRFAMAALTGVFSSHTNIKDNDRAVAEYCYELADAMMEARKK